MIRYLIIIIFILGAGVVKAIPRQDSLLEESEQLLLQAKFLEAKKAIDSLVSLAARTNQRTLYYQALNQKGYILTRMGRYDSAYSIHTSILEESMNLGFTDMEFRTKYFLGVTKLFMSEFDAAEKYFSEVVDYFRIDDSDNQGLLGRSLTNLAFLAFQSGSIEAAKEYLEESIGYLSDPILEVHSAANYSLRGLIYLQEGRLKLSQENYEIARDIYRKSNRRLNLSGVFLGFASVYQSAGDFDMTQAYLDSALMVASGPYLGRELLAVYERLYRFHYDQGNYHQSIDHLLRRDQIRDSLNNTEQLLRVVQLESNSDKKLEEMRVSLLQKQLVAEQENNRVQKVWIFIILIVSLYLLVFILVYRKLIKDKNKSQQELLIKNNELEDKNQQIAKAQQLLIKSEKMALLGRISSGIAHELNTPIGAIKGNLDLLHNLNQLEFERIKSVVQHLNERTVGGILAIAEESIKNNRILPELAESKARRQKIEHFFEEVEIPNKPQVIDYFIELGVYEEIQSYYPLYSHERNIDLLEIATHVSTRVSSIRTSLTAIGKAMKILGSFKTYSFKRGWKDIKPLNLSSCFSLILQLHKNDLRNIKVSKVVEGDVVIEGIQDELDQVWTNLVTNAIHAMKYEGELRIEIKGLTNAVSVTISDTGGGIHLPAGQDIFEPFFTTKPEGEGSGLGLDISKQIVKNHYGSISWKNVNEGAKFTVVLPRSLDKSLILDEQ